MPIFYCNNKDEAFTIFLCHVKYLTRWSADVVYYTACDNHFLLQTISRHNIYRYGILRVLIQPVHKQTILRFLELVVPEKSIEKLRIQNITYPTQCFMVMFYTGFSYRRRPKE